MEKDAKFGVWVYYVNEEGKARWKCSLCGKICHRDPHDKLYLLEVREQEHEGGVSVSRALVIRTAGDPEIAAAISEGINAVELRAVRAEYAKLQARDAVRCEGDDRRWQRTRRRLARKYRVRPVGRVEGAILGVWALVWYAIYHTGEVLSAYRG